MKLSELIERMQRNIEIWGDPEITLEKLVQIYRIESGAYSLPLNEKEYRELLIDGILVYQQNDEFTMDALEKQPIRVLERIYDNI